MFTHLCVCVLTICVWFVFSKEKDVRHLSVYLGKTAINDTDADREQSFTVEKLIIHQKYNESSFDNDIGAHNSTMCMYVSERDKELRGCFVCRTHSCVCLCISALMKIKSSDGGCAVKSASARTACLPPLHTKLPAGFQCSIAGYGMEKHSMYCRTSNLQIQD